MKLTVEAVSKMTGLTESTVRQYAWKMKLGKVESRQKCFTLAEAKKLGGLQDGSKKAKKSRCPASKALKPKKAVPTEKRPNSEAKKTTTQRQSFWSFLGIGRK